MINVLFLGMGTRLSALDSGKGCIVTRTSDIQVVSMLSLNAEDGGGLLILVEGNDFRKMGMRRHGVVSYMYRERRVLLRNFVDYYTELEHISFPSTSLIYRNLTPKCK
jgi:hypothetical protein